MLTLEELVEAVCMTRMLILMAKSLYAKLAQESVSELLKTQKKMGLKCSKGEALFLGAYNMLNYGDSK